MIKPHVLRLTMVASVAAFAIASPLRAQPVAAPAALAFNRADTLPISANAMRPVELAERSRMQVVKKGMWIGAATGALLGFAASTYIYSGGCEPMVRINPDGSRGKPNCSSLTDGLAYGALLSLTGGTVGGVLGAGVGAMVGGRGGTRIRP